MIIALSDDYQRIVQSIVQKMPIITAVAQQLQMQERRLFLVGGAVRDIYMHAFSVDHDIDIEVHGVSLVELEQMLRQFGTVMQVGKSFGVLKVAGVSIDWSLPRLDSSGRKPQVTIVENLSIEQALARRDVTINAMAIDLCAHKLYDPFHGLADLHAKILRTPHPDFFIQDPLRFYRVMQFIGRFEMYPDQILQSVCQSMDISSVSRERIELEFHKLMLKSARPSLGIRWLRDVNRIREILPEVAQLCGVMQQADYHPEGDVFEHTMQALDAAAELTYEHIDQPGPMPSHGCEPGPMPLHGYRKLTIMYAALCHDLGKVSTTQCIDGRLRSFGHEIAGVPLARSLLQRITLHKELIEKVCLLVRYHMMPGGLVKGNASLAAYKRLAAALGSSVNMYMLSLLAVADRRGRNSDVSSGKPLQDDVPMVDTFIKRAQQAGVLYHSEAPILTGKDLLDVMQPGPLLGKVVAKAYAIQINKGITDKAELKRRALA